MKHYQDSERPQKGHSLLPIGTTILEEKEKR